MSIEKIKIVIKTAIPGKEPFELKRDILYIPDSQDKAVPSSEYPFITSTRLFNKSELQNYAYTYGYSKIVYYFFDKITFERFFTLYTIADDVEPVTNTMTPKEKMDRNNTIKKNLIANINIMLELLFPMTYPATFNISDSYKLYIRQNIDFDLNNTFSNITKTFFKKIMAVTQAVQTKNFSYIKVDGAVYTVTKLIWLNDILNHPVYRDFINEFIGFKQLAEQQKESLDGVITKAQNMLFERIQDTSEGGSSLNIYKECIGPFIKNFNENVKSLQNRRQYDNSKIQQFINDLKNIILLILKVFNLHYSVTIKGKTKQTIDSIQTSMENNIKNASKSDSDTPIPTITFTPPDYNEKNKNTMNTDNYLKDLTQSTNDLNELYTKLKQSNVGSLTGIPGFFTSRLNKIIDEIKTINVNITIKEKYLSEKTTINLTGEDQTVIDTLTKRFPSYIAFADKIKALIYPTRITTNAQLQEMIDNYSNGKKINGKKSFDEIMEAIKEQYILMTTQKSSQTINLLSNEEDQKLIQTEICKFTESDPNVPHYEIYIALNLIEGEMKSTNINDIKCMYRSMYLGKELQNYFTRYNKYDANQHLFLLSKKDIEEENTMDNLKVTTTNNQAPIPPPPETQPKPPMPPAPPAPPAPPTQGGTRKRCPRKKNKRKTYCNSK
jgi:hypothetical protein